MKIRFVHKLWILSGCLLACSLSWASRKDEITLVMVPRDDAAVKVGMDLAERFPTLLIRYRTGAGGAISLNGWTGREWVSITPAAFQAGDFFKNGPRAALIVKADGEVLPDALIPPATWVDSVYQIGTSDARAFLHLAGRFYNFKFKEWTWFAKRHSMSLEAINPDGLNVAWYHKRLNEHMAAKKQPVGSDLQYWAILRSPPAPPEAPAPKEPIEPEPVVAPVMEDDQPVEMADVVPETEEEVAPVAEEEAPVSASQEEPAVAEEAAHESVEIPVPAEMAKPEVDPFASDAPAALVLSADHAVEEKGDADEKVLP